MSCLDYFCCKHTFMVVLCSFWTFTAQVPVRFRCILQSHMRNLQNCFVCLIRERNKILLLRITDKQIKKYFGMYCPFNWLSFRLYFTSETIYSVLCLHSMHSGIDHVLKVLKLLFVPLTVDSDSWLSVLLPWCKHMVLGSRVWFSSVCSYGKHATQLFHLCIRGVCWLRVYCVCFCVDSQLF